MGQVAKLLQFERQDKAKTQPKSGDEIKYYTEQQIKALRRAARDVDTLARQKGLVTGVREWLVVDILTNSGLRVAECANLRCGDVRTAYGESELFIRDGKGSKSRTVQIPDSLKKHLKSYIAWKRGRGEPTGEDYHLLLGQRGPMTEQAVQKLVKKYLKRLGLYVADGRHGVHALRHSYAVQYYRNTKDLRGLQKQLGHASIQTTQIYADVLKEDIQDNLKGLWG